MIPGMIAQGGLLALVLGFCAPLGAAVDAKAREIVDAALNAHGGVPRITMYQAANWTEKGIYYGRGEGIAYTGTYAMQGPTRFRMEIARAFVRVIDGDQGWIQAKNETRPLTKEELDEQRESLHAAWVATLAPLADPNYNLSWEGEAQINGKIADCIRVNREGHRDVLLWFDRVTSQLVKSSSIVKSQETDNQDVQEEILIDESQEIRGVRVPRRVTILRAGKKFVEATIETFQLAEKADDSHFAKP